jgi:23S rRNA (uracil1939-C5)-methyltransferase
LTNSGARSVAESVAAQSLVLDDLLENGQGVGRSDGLVTFVTGGLPGERVRVAVDSVKRTYVSAHVVTIESASADRVDPGCPVFPRCGGCQTLHYRYERQLEWKRRLVADALERLGGLRDVEVDETIAPPGDPRAGYRNKVSLVTRYAGGAMRLGFYEARSHRIVPVERCPVLLPRLDAALSQLVRFAADEPEALGGVTHIVARASSTRDELVVSFNGEKPNKRLGALTGELLKRIPALTGVAISWDLAGENAVFGRRSATLWGSPVVRETIAGATFSFGIASFFQINAATLELIAQRLCERLAGSRRVVDLYSGVGTFSVVLGMRGISTTGVESFAPAAGEAAANAAENGVTNASFEHADVADAVAGERGRTLLAGADAIVLDPPRKGCEPAVLTALSGNRVPRVVYISCNPATLARDAKALTASGYRLERVSPYDMFPHTGHVETVAEFTYSGDAARDAAAAPEEKIERS